MNLSAGPAARWSVFLCACVLMAPANVRAAVEYTLVNLGANGGDRSVAYSINDSGQVVGYFRASLPDPEEPFVWSNGTMTPLTLGSGVAYSINNAGQIAGTFDAPTGERAFRYTNGTGENLGSLGGQFSLSRGWGINASGQVTGDTPVPTGPIQAFRHSNGVMTALGTLGGPQSFGRAINDAGVVVGFSNVTSTVTHAFKTVGNTMVDLGNFAGIPFASSNSEAYAINNLGHVVGFGSHTSGGRAFLHDGTTMINLGTLPGYAHSRAWGVNDLDHVVGIAHNNELGLTPFVWRDGIMRNLADLVAPDPNFVMHEALDINNVGQIVGWGVYDPDGAGGPQPGQFRAFLLNPIPEPAGAFALASFAAAAVMRRRRSHARATSEAP